MSTTASVLVVDPDEQLREALRALLPSTGLEVRACGTGEEALAAMDEALPAVVVADAALPGLSGYELCRAIRELHGEAIGVVLLSARDTTAADRTLALLLGADDHLAKPVDWGELMARVGRLFAHAQPSAGARPEVVVDGAAHLTPREREVLQLLAQGMAQEEICRTLVIAPKTVSAHIQRILAKTGAHSRAQAIAFAYRDGLVASGAPAEPGRATLPG